LLICRIWDHINIATFLFARELEKIKVEGDDLYLPTAPTKLVRGIQVDSGIPLQSAAKVPIMITFNVVDRNGDPNDVKPQACIFKVILQLVLLSCIVEFIKRNQLAFQNI